MDTRNEEAISAGNMNAVFKKLDELGINYDITKHKAVYTIEEMDELGLYSLGSVCKNLFLRDAKGKNHFLVVLEKDKKADLKHIQSQIGCSALSFGSEERLMKHLGLEKGSVSPLGVINNQDHKVYVILDSALAGASKLGIHPNDNTATVWIAPDDLFKLIKSCKNPLKFIDI